ncbi:LV211 protein, partial [Brachypteracias leptosomus]|nr:LV211 protein [Brachypteracias leptosomus]
GQAQVLLKQEQASVTGRPTKSAQIECRGEGISDFGSDYIHWYRQLPTKAPERILYFGSDVAYDDSSYKNKYSAWKRGGDTCVLRINDINSADEGIYYCAYW